MPSHIDVLCGDYRSSVIANQAAVRADHRFVERAGPVNFYSLYRAHDLHFIVYSAMFEGQSEVALQAAGELAEQLTPELLAIESPPMADWLEAFVPLRIHVLVRFGRWDELIAEPLPVDPLLYCTTTATVHYGRGVAYAATGRLPEAHAERDAFEAAYAAIPETRYLFNNTGRDILAIGRAMLDGEIAYREGRFEEAFESLRQAIALDDGLPYDEPWGWMQPTRHAYGALLSSRAASRSCGGLRRRPRSRPDAEPLRASIPATCGVCTATTSASPGSAATTRRRSSVASCSSREPGQTCRSRPLRVPAGRWRARLLRLGSKAGVATSPHVQVWQRPTREPNSRRASRRQAWSAAR